MGNGDEGVAEAGTASGGFTGMTTRCGRIEEGRLPRARSQGAELHPLHTDTVRHDGNRRQRRRRSNRSSHHDASARVVATATSPSPTFMVLAATVVVVATPLRSTEKMAKATGALIAREAENSIHNPMKGDAMFGNIASVVERDAKGRERSNLLFSTG
uniref:Uncharacterized protein n=1 Tax=Oryza sativa subsp. japonica TaxID=39947 RepID=Q8GVT5_ORYSJ|nr:hypothetical protein [Oryza sativa Japonica Group]BAD31255.1 hypothetical protein [Oryza sativa Japonica Group]